MLNKGVKTCKEVHLSLRTVIGIYSENEGRIVKFKDTIIRLLYQRRSHVITSLRISSCDMSKKTEYLVNCHLKNFPDCFWNTKMQEAPAKTKCQEDTQKGCIPVHLDFILSVHLDRHTSGSSRVFIPPVHLDFIHTSGSSRFFSYLWFI